MRVQVGADLLQRLLDGERRVVVVEEPVDREQVGNDGVVDVQSLPRAKKKSKAERESRSREEESASIAGPLGFAKLLVASGEFDRCAVQRFYARFVGQYQPTFAERVASPMPKIERSVMTASASTPLPRSRSADRRRAWVVPEAAMATGRSATTPHGT